MRSSSVASAGSSFDLSTPSMPGDLAPEDARATRAASASQTGLATNRSRRSNLRSLSAADHIASLHCISLIIKGLHLFRGQLICHASYSNCSPSPCNRLSLSQTTTEAPPAMGASGSHSLGIPPSPSPVHMLDSNTRVRSPVAVFILACRKSSRTLRDSYALHVAQ